MIRDSLHYRKLTDKPKLKDEDNKENDKSKDSTKEKNKDLAADEALTALAYGKNL